MGKGPERTGEGEKILLHICCAPCSTHAIELLRGEGWGVIGFYYNPNIYPEKEYRARVREAENYCRENDIELIVGEYDGGRWEERVEPLAHLGEGSGRCDVCFRVRLDRCARMAMERKIDAFTTTLTISPHKNSSHIFRIGRDVGREDGIRFMEYNFKKRDGFARSLVLSREHELYRQDYCGCRYSLRERKEREAKGTRVMNKKG